MSSHGTKFIGWMPWERELLRGAMLERDSGDTDALNDCAVMLCRSRRAVLEMALKLTRPVTPLVVKSAVIFRPAVKVTQTPSAIHRFTPAELMCGRARAKHTPIRELYA